VADDADAEIGVLSQARGERQQLVSRAAGQ
jgi:hypothetical protein